MGRPAREVFGDDGENGAVERLKEKIRPHYFKGESGCPPKGIELMLRMYFLQVWFNLADEAVEEQIYDS
jgi:IS5 family transposase